MVWLRACADVNYDAVAKEVSAGQETPGEQIIFQGTTWPACLIVRVGRHAHHPHAPLVPPCSPWLLAAVQSPLCCSSIHWRISNHRLDWDHGCCSAHSDTLDMRRIKVLPW
jgi:hypothetical protein